MKKSPLKRHNKPHLIGRHGAIGFLTKQGLICAECKKKIKDEQYARKNKKVLARKSGYAMR